MSAETPVQSVGTFTRARLGFRKWRGSRPFWAGLLTALGGVPIAYFPYATLKLGTMSVTMSTTAGAGSLIIGVLLVTLGLTMWFQKATRVFAGVAAIILGLVSLVVSNIGGFVIGFLLALLGGAMAVSWVPTKAKPERAEAAPGAGKQDPDGESAVPPAAPAQGESGAADGPAAPFGARPPAGEGTADARAFEDQDGGYRVR
ncbi:MULTISPECIES: DUF6114 domain-containing protein [Streptomyces]|jgi:hypothetical protein|uniref:DUF6114 domain-containing protein n=1 Tax=Streptomyces griseoaurantiacus TaxID=68213 RepID=A0A1G7G1M8_9ACTN|nr:MULTISPECIES: DUF6114 domain-containing protein [Streptomyces]GHE62722.1 hypothetical protein GCM10018782_41080 [Streptomyces griseoaurantiacus]MDX3363466.1 DUF6114 domain-containing protein [Streptomyces sp. ME02-6978.2a]NJP69378.1 hypothetical protein [Streptomyces sp. C1-2]WTI28999.1 DUF6114 domain-containing protein [Streptomyces jietaisiensis]SDE82003.1 hypothetical protein SAMN05216260_10426 [Streptomyces jietaisiensis]